MLSDILRAPSKAGEAGKLLSKSEEGGLAAEPRAEPEHCQTPDSARRIRPKYSREGKSQSLILLSGEDEDALGVRHDKVSTVTKPVTAIWLGRWVLLPPKGAGGGVRRVPQGDAGMAGGHPRGVVAVLGLGSWGAVGAAVGAVPLAGLCLSRRRGTWRRARGSSSAPSSSASMLCSTALVSPRARLPRARSSRWGAALLSGQILSQRVVEVVGRGVGVPQPGPAAPGSVPPLPVASVLSPNPLPGDWYMGSYVLRSVCLSVPPSQACTHPLQPPQSLPPITAALTSPLPGFFSLAEQRQRDQKSRLRR